jgi:hypothetical protein
MSNPQKASRDVRTVASIVSERVAFNGFIGTLPRPQNFCSSCPLQNFCSSCPLIEWNPTAPTPAGLPSSARLDEDVGIRWSVLARATTYGRFVVAPVKAEEMYHPETFARSATEIVEVR